MTTLLLRLAGPMQSWGTQSRFTVRDTDREPSKSGVIGLLCAALGRPREASLTDLASLRFGVRVNHEGKLQLDYHTAGGGRSDSASDSGNAHLSSRYYLADADFLVGLEGDRALLTEIDLALDAPMWQLSLGRKSFVPGVPIRLPDHPPLGPGLREASLEDALRGYPWPGGGSEPLRFVMDAPFGSQPYVRRDVPLAFAFGRREFASRCVSVELHPPPEATS